MKSAPRSLARRGFTLVELLVVVAIIFILMGLTAGAVLRYHDIQQKRNTEWLLGKLDSILTQQRNALITQAKDEGVPPAIWNQLLQMAGGNTDSQAGPRARVLWIKMRLMQEFPMNYQEAMMGVQPFLPPKASYQAALTPTPPRTVPQYDSKGNAFNANIESAVCLYLALQLNRGGTNINVDQAFTARELTPLPKTVDPGQQYAIKYFVDDWKRPLAFFRWPYGSAELNPPNANPNQPTAAGSMDLEDPLNLLSMPGWKGGAGVGGLLGYPVGPGSSFKLLPVVASAGRDGRFGLDSLDNGAPPAGMVASNPRFEFDNLYSYRVRQTGRGD
jgi:prepilin-type N-terminal cleavage/methylation domain-containing protein